MNALNLPLSPEKMEFWECADLVDVSAGETGIAIQTSDIRPPGVSDSICAWTSWGEPSSRSESAIWLSLTSGHFSMKFLTNG